MSTDARTLPSAPQISVDRSEKTSTCRSCSRSIAAETPRVKIAYPQVVIKYVERTGSPSFFMHLECFRDCPVDYIKDGPHPWRNWQPIKRFSYQESQIAGLDRCPDAAAVLLSSNNKAPSNQVKLKGADLAAQAAIPGQSVTISAAKRSQVQLPHSNTIHGSASLPEPSSAAKRPRVHVHFKIPSFAEILEECLGDREEADKQYRVHLDLAAKREAAYLRATKAESKLKNQAPESKHNDAANEASTDQHTVQHESVLQPRRGLHSSSGPRERCEIKHESDVESDSTSGSDEENEVDNNENSGHSLQWMKPGQLSQQVGINISILRRWANLRAVRTIISAGGHRLFNVASVVNYIKQQELKAASEPSLIKDDVRGAPVVIFVRVPNNVKLRSIQSESRKVTDSAASVHRQDTVAHMQQQLRSAYPSSKLIIELPEIPLKDFRHRDCLTRLYALITKQQISKILLKTPDDISDDATAYALFEWICAKHDVAITVVPDLYTV